jgi:site-specific DNA-cytosine methylase
MARILIACEESQATTKAFRELGHEAFSCDLLPCSGGHPEWHFQCDIFEIIDQGWDLMVAHPPCTYLTGSGVQWLSNPEDKHLPFEDRRPHPKYPNRRNDMLDSVEFVKALYNSNIKHIAVENPVGLLSSRWRKPDQIVQPYMFGDEATKTTCLWLKNLPLLEATNIVGKGERTVFSSGKSHPKWYADALKNAKTKEERQTLRSKTFEGMAKAFAEQWGLIL